MTLKGAVVLLVAAGLAGHAEAVCESHADCESSAAFGTQYCSTNDNECWPCLFCQHFRDSVTGECSSICPEAPPSDNDDAGEAPVDDEPAETTAAPTPPPPAPTTTTAAPTTTTAAAEGSTTTNDCPRNCGPGGAEGGNTCRLRAADNTVICTSCKHGRVLFKGKCLLSYHCRARRVQSGSMKGLGCKCTNSHCHNCKVYGEGGRDGERGSEECLICRDGWYMAPDGSDCIETCPSTHASSGISLFKRRCLEPYTCKSGKLWDGDPFDGGVMRDTNYGCRCPAPGNNVGGNCFACEHFAGGVGDHCLRCNNKKYLNLETNVCGDDCPPGTVKFSSGGSYGRECRPE